jgi:hypothetical protein
MKVTVVVPKLFAGKSVSGILSTLGKIHYDQYTLPLLTLRFHKGKIRISKENRLF